MWSWNMALTWQTMAFPIPTAVRTLLRSRYVRSGTGRGKGGPQIENRLLQNVSLCLQNPVQPSLLTSTVKIYYRILSCSLSSWCANRQIYKFVSVELFAPRLLAVYPPCWLFRRSSVQGWFWLCTSQQLLPGVSHRSPASRAQLSLPGELKPTTFSWCPHKHFRGKCASVKSVCEPSLSFSKDLAKWKDPTFFFLRKNVLHCTWSECTWSKIVPWNPVFIQDHWCRYLST